MKVEQRILELLLRNLQINKKSVHNYANDKTIQISYQYSHI